ncbi:restriction endonuclease subunit S [Sulfurovum riftiae]|uniref:Type I restriction modification DNA specificity domain-containing protein n=1 Tax=Sulfurovum riftiae TaxID=1630136 RepID=A0A151CEZ0_9BACT|nr:restriction endonuclease subunit S [Sulfurovum riftiae]KYJ85823.1 hypothetical protein AS592_03535 [Sulfurovum riftiae]
MNELYVLPEGWEWKKLVDKDVCQLIMGQSPKSDTYNSEGKGMPFFQGKTEFGEMYPTVSKYCTAPKKIAQVGDILLSVRAPVGPTNIANIECCIGRGLGAIRPNEENTLTNYLLYFFRNFELEISQKGKGSTFSAITKKELENTDIPLPPLQEQKRIVAKLNSLFAKIDQAIALHQQNIDEAERFMGSVLNEVFGELEGKYEKRTLFSFHPKISAGGTPLRKESSYWNGDIEWYSSGELNQLYTLPAKEKITQVGLENSSAKLFPKGTLLIGMYDTAAMKMSILSNDGSCNQAIVGFKPQEDELNIFFAKYQLEYLKEKILEQRQGVRQKNLNLSKIKNIELEYPPLETQQKTVQYLDQLSQKTERLKEVQTEKMESLKALKASILDRAFRGEI